MTVNITRDGFLGYGVVTIASGATLSDAIDLKDCRLVAIGTPAGLTSVALSFVGSHDDVTYRQVRDATGVAVGLTVAVSGLYAPADLGTFAGVRFLKVVGGTTEGADRLITVLAQAL